VTTTITCRVCGHVGEPRPLGDQDANGGIRVQLLACTSCGASHAGRVWCARCGHDVQDMDAHRCAPTRRTLVYAWSRIGGVQRRYDDHDARRDGRREGDW
jgi:ribosomal protein S27AE